MDFKKITPVFKHYSEGNVVSSLKFRKPTGFKSQRSRHMRSSFGFLFSVLAFASYVSDTLNKLEIDPGFTKEKEHK